ncbi:MAG: glycosidase [Candidatus Limnocylindrales bacterium]|jgi:predicted GH43/DUF377 family glycosyl hydrolase
MADGRSLFVRHPSNPILTVDDVPYPANTAFNPGAARVNGETVLLLRVEDLRGISSLLVARSTDGITGWRVDEKPLLAPDPDHPEEVWGCEDPRIVFLPERGEWAITYTAYSRRGPLVSLAMTKDFREVERLGPVMPPDDKDAALFSRRFDGRWILVHRPAPLRGSAHIWISYSPDLRHWGDHALLLEAREGAWWDAVKIGLGPPPLATPAGWLMMYHGAHMTASGPIYRVGLALLDLEHPEVVLRRSDEWVLAPTTTYEAVGDVDKVIFPNGWVLDEAADRLALYYGAGDSVVGLAEARFSEVMDYMGAAPLHLHRRTSDADGG